MRQYCDSLRNAIELGAVPAALNALVAIAEAYMERGDAERATEILALVLCYPMNRNTREDAITLFDALGETVCQRVLADARARADVMTLEDLANEVLVELGGE